MIHLLAIQFKKDFSSFFFNSISICNATITVNISVQCLHMQLCKNIILVQCAKKKSDLLRIAKNKNCLNVIYCKKKNTDKKVAIHNILLDQHNVFLNNCE